MGLAFLGVTLYSVFHESFENLPGLFLAPLFLYYAAVGNKGLSKVGFLKKFSEKVNFKNDV
jgi:hypothetical protein